MLRGEGASEERCWRIRFRFFTVWNTRFGCSLEKHDHIESVNKSTLNISLSLTAIYLCFHFKVSQVLKWTYLCSSTSGSSIWSSFLMVPSISAARESWRGRQQKGKLRPRRCCNTARCVNEYELTIGNKPREWKRLVVLSGRVLFLRFFSSSWASWSISMHSAYLSCSSRNWRTGKGRSLDQMWMILNHNWLLYP